jgi:hypothetical protein
MDNYEGNTMFLCYKLLLNRKEIRNEKTERKRQRRAGSGKNYKGGKLLDTSSSKRYILQHGRLLCWNCHLFRNSALSVT